MRRWLGLALAVLCATPANAAPEPPATEAPATEVRIAPSPEGVLGAWLVAGPFPAPKHDALGAAPAGVDEAALAPSTSATKLRWTIASNDDGPVDLRRELHTKAHHVVAYAAGTLHLARAGHLYLLLGVDDGVRVSVDGRVVYTHDEARPLRTDDDVVPLDLSAGDHALVLKLHQRAGAWKFRARLVDETLAPPEGASLRLPGTDAGDARALAARMGTASVARTFDGATGVYRPTLTVRFSEGAPRGVPLDVRAQLAGAGGFDVSAGLVPVGARGVSELEIALPPIAPSPAARTVEVTAAGDTTKATLWPRPASERALAHVASALAHAPADLPSASRASVAYLTHLLEEHVADGDRDAVAQSAEAHELDRLASALDRGEDPYAHKTGAMRRAIVSRADGQPSEIGVWVPPSYKPGTSRRYPLVVGLHGMNGRTMSMMRAMFGHDDPDHNQYWEDRHWGTLSGIDAFVITPFAHGNAMYREIGEQDIDEAVQWMTATYPIDPSRITITGVSMGGTGSAGVPLHRPSVYAAAEPLCGYQSYLIRRDVRGHHIRPWERFVAESRSNALWAENGLHLPLYIVHGKRDKPERNSGVLIERYEKLGYSIQHEHPDLGHNVWATTYENLKGVGWLLGHKADLHPSRVLFKTTRTRWGTNAWVTIDELASPSSWGEVDARKASRTKITAKTKGVATLTFTRDDHLFDPAGAITVDIDGGALAFEAGEPLVMHRDDGAWAKGPATHDGLFKHGRVTGPLRDVFHEPVVFVYGSGPEARANEQVARRFARGWYWGMTVKYPVMSDVEFFAKGEPVANDRALFLVGRDNRVLRALEQIERMPIHVERGAVEIGGERITGREVGAAFIRPNPARPDRYVVVVAGADVAGTLRARSLPSLLPDFVVWDEDVRRARHRTLLGPATVRAAGFFESDWSLPASFADPYAKPRP